MSEKHNVETRKPLATVPRPTKLYRSETYDQISLRSSGFQGLNKTVLITGGATGVGFAIANAFAKAGVKRIIIVSRSLESLDKAKADLSSRYPDVDTLTFSASVTDHQRMNNILGELNTVDILVHSAVMINDATPVESIPPDTIQEIFATNFFGPLSLFKTYCKLEHPAAKTIINVSSAAAGITFPFNSIYGASKAALAQIIQHMASEQLAKPANERVNFFTFHPGHFHTPLISRYVREDWVDWDNIELAGDYAVWLCGPHSKFLQGRFTWATWDMEELVESKERILQDPHYLTIGLRF